MFTAAKLKYSVARGNAINTLRQWAGFPEIGAPTRLGWAAMQQQMGITDREPLVILKQYGEYRTGSNALRALLIENFDNALVLMHALGDKHREAHDFAKLARIITEPGVDPCCVLMDATWSRPGGVTRPENFLQLAFVRCFSDQIAESVQGGRLKVVLSIRHPVPWVEAVMRFWDWPGQPTGDTWLDIQGANLARDLCARFNGLYRSWRGALAMFRDRALVVPFELLHNDSEQVVVSAASTFSLHLRHGHPVSQDREVLPSPWDNAPPCYTKPRRNVHQTVRRQLMPEIREVVDGCIDWELLAGFGYSRDPDVLPIAPALVATIS